MGYLAVNACARQEPETDPVVVSIQARSPQSGEDLVVAIRNLLDIRRPDVALGYLEKLGRLTLDDAGWFALAREAGSDFIFRVATDPQLQPTGRQVAELFIEAGQRVANDPARLEQLTRTVANRDIAIRSAALDDLRALGSVGAVALLNALADSAGDGDAPYLRRALAEFGEAAVDPIQGGIRAADPRLREESIRAAGAYVASDLVALLLRPYLDVDSTDTIRAAAEASLQKLLPRLPTRVDATELLQGKIRQHLGSLSTDQFPAGENATLFRVNPETKRLTKLVRSAVVVDRMLAAEFAEDLLHIAPGDRGIEREYALALLEATKYARGFEVPIWHTAAMQAVEKLGIEAMAEVLNEALQRDLVGAAMAACEALGRLGAAEGGRVLPSDPLVRAAKNSDVRVRFAACQALIDSNPVAGFAGCSDVLQTMIELAGGAGRPKVLVALPNRNEAEQVAATLDKLGFQAEPMTSGRQLLQAAAADSDVQLALVSDRLNPGVGELLSHLRNHPKSRRIPVAVMYQAEENIVAQRGGADRQDVLAHLVVDGRKFVDYDRWVQSYVNSSIADLHPLLIIVPPGNTATALGLATQRGHVKFIEMDEESPLISNQLLERVRTEFRLDRAPVCVVIEPVSSSTPRTDVSVSLVLDPSEWPDWAQWTRLLHDNPVTSVVDVVLGTTRDVQRFTALDQQISAESTRTIPAQDIEFLFQLVINTISTEKALWTSFIDPRAQRRALALEEQYERVIAVPATLDARLIARQIERLNEWMRLDNPSLPLRQRFAEQAAGWLEEIASRPERYPFRDLTQLDRAVVGLAQSSEVSPAICRTLGALGTPQAQAQLLLIVEQPSTPLPVRQAAAAAFQHAVEQRGIFLTREQLQRQYDRFNASATLPEEVRTLYASILDALEARAKASQ